MSENAAWIIGGAMVVVGLFFFLGIWVYSVRERNFLRLTLGEGLVILREISRAADHGSAAAWNVELHVKGSLHDDMKELTRAVNSCESKLFALDQEVKYHHGMWARLGGKITPHDADHREPKKKQTKVNRKQ